MHSFNLDLQRVSPNKETSFAFSTNARLKTCDSWTPPSIAAAAAPAPTSVPSASAPPMPSLNLLVDASLLTAFKRDMTSQLTPTQEVQRSTRTMSMQDILTLRQ